MNPACIQSRGFVIKEHISTKSPLLIVLLVRYLQHFRSNLASTLLHLLIFYANQSFILKQKQCLTLIAQLMAL